MRGGRREGAGRKLKQNARRETISFRVTCETKRKIQALRQEGYDTNEMLETIANECYADLIGIGE